MSSSATKNRRSTATKAAKPKAPKAAKPAKAATKEESNVTSLPKSKVFPGNVVVERRLAFLSNADRKKAAAKFLAGAKIGDLVAEFSGAAATAKAITATRLTYAIAAELVEEGKVSKLSPTLANLRKAEAESNSLALIASRFGVSEPRLADPAFAKKVGRKPLKK